MNEIYEAVRERIAQCKRELYRKAGTFPVDDYIAKSIAEAVPEKKKGIETVSDWWLGWNAFHNTLLKNLRGKKDVDTKPNK